MNRKTRQNLLLGGGLLGSVVVGLVSIAFPNELAGKKQLKSLARVEAEDTEELRVTIEVGSRGGRCVVFAGRVLATEQEVQDLARHFESNAEGVVWAEPGRFSASTPEGTDIEAPAPAVALLTQWAIVPDGVRRVVVFRQVPAPSAWDPRCW